MTELTKPKLIELYADPDMDQACYLSRLMGKLNKSYDDKDNELPEYVRDRWGLVSTYIYAVGDSLLRKHREAYLNKFTIRTIDVLLNMPDDQIIEASIKDMNRLPPTFLQSVEVLIGKAHDADPIWERHFEAHVREFEKDTWITPKAFGFVE